MGIYIVAFALLKVAATVAFLIARYFARERILKLVEGNKKFLAIDKAIGENGFRVVTLLRLSPLLPFSLGNYLYGLTSVKLIPYVLGRYDSHLLIMHLIIFLLRWPLIMLISHDSVNWCFLFLYVFFPIVSTRVLFNMLSILKRTDTLWPCCWSANIVTSLYVKLLILSKFLIFTFGTPEQE